MKHNVGTNGGYCIMPRSLVYVLISLVMIILPLCICHPVRSQVLCVATDGNDSNPGTETRAFGSLEKAVEAVDPGETILIRGGIYTPRRTIVMWLRRKAHQLVGLSGREPNPGLFESSPKGQGLGTQRQLLVFQRTRDHENRRQRHSNQRLE